METKKKVEEEEKAADSEGCIGFHVALTATTPKDGMHLASSSSLDGCHIEERR